MNKTSIESMFKIKSKSPFGFPNYSPLIHYFDGEKQIQSRKIIKKGGAPKIKATKRGSYLDFYTK